MVLFIVGQPRGMNNLAVYERPVTADDKMWQIKCILQSNRKMKLALGGTALNNCLPLASWTRWSLAEVLLYRSSPGVGGFTLFHLNH